MRTSHIKLLGKPDIEIDERPSALLKSAKGLALLAYLIVTEQAHTREVVADLLWEATATAKSLNNLRQLLSRMRKWLPDLQISATEVGYEAGGFVDLYELRSGLTAVSPHTLDQALQLYQGELLAGLYLPDAPRFNEWLMLEREQLRQKIAAAYEQLCEKYVEQEDWLKGIAAAQRWLALDDLDEIALQYLLQFLAASGQVELALQQYEVSRQRLWVELAVEPEPETVQLAQRLQQLKERQGSGLSWDVIVGAQVERPQPGHLAEPGKLPSQAIIPYQRNNDFTGRSESLLRLSSLLLPEDDSTRCRAVAITGMGGLGKTQIAVEFCYRYGRYFPGGVFWLSFANAETVADEVAAIGGERGMGLYRDVDKLTQLDKVGRVRRAWQEAVPRLLIFDNCEEEALLTEWLPVTGGCQVLLTSRRGVWTPELGVTLHALTRLERAESIQLLQQLIAHIDTADVAAIASEVGDLPLALYLAGSFLRRYQQIEVADYLAQLRQRGSLQHPSLQGRGATHSPTGHELDVARTFAINFEQLEAHDETDAMAKKLLACTIAFAHGEPIPQQLLLDCILIEEDELLAKLLAMDGLTRLLTLGLLRSISGEQVRIHRLVAEFAAVELSEALVQEGQTAVENRLITLLTNQNQGVWGLATLPLASTHLSHLVEIARRRSDRRGTHLLTLWGCHQRDRGQFEEAEQHLKSALALHQAMGTLYDSEGVEILRLLSGLYLRMGNYTQAQAYSEQHLAILEGLAVADEFQVAQGTNLLGVIFMSQGRFTIAQEYLEKSSHLYQVYFEADPWQGEYHLLNLAVLYMWKGEYEAALNLMERNLQAMKVHTGSEHQETALVLNYLGDIHFYLNNIEKAFALNEQALKIRQKTLGPKHLQTAFSLTSLGKMMLNSGRMPEAQAYLEEALAIREQVQGKNHRLTAICLCLLGQLHLQRGDIEIAKNYLDRALAIRKQVLGDDHPETAESLINLGEWYLSAEKDGEKAKTLFEQAQTTLAGCVAATHVSYQRLQRNLAMMVGEP